jgi:DNA-binding Xre family transcriptional regulator
MSIPSIFPGGFMIRLKVQELALERGFNISTLSREAKLEIRLVRRYWHNQVRSVSLDALEEIAKILEVGFFDLFEVTSGDSAPSPSKKN